MTHKLIWCVALIITAESATPSRACSVFSTDTNMGRIVAKNFDWQVGSGVVTVNRRGAVRTPVFSYPPGDGTWEARFGSLSFSPIGPGFPISGMNETGLVVEGLHHTDFDGHFVQIDGLIALEWAQYVLDMFTTVDEVRRFAEKTGFIQFALPIHFLVCDQTGACLVAEGQDSGMTIISGVDLKAPVLANHGWRRDYRAAAGKKKGAGLLATVASFFSGERFTRPSAKRFRVLLNARETPRFKNDPRIFNTLDDARIVSLTKWQIIWHQDDRLVTWRHYDGNRPSPPHTIDFDTLHFQCTEKPDMVADTMPLGAVALAPCGAECRANTAARIRRIFNFLSIDLSPSFMTRLAAATAGDGCTKQTVVQR